MNLGRLYLDYNATSPLSTSVLNWLKSGEVIFANPSSQHSAGKSSRKIINEVRADLFKTFSLSEKETDLFFHSGATEGIQTIAHSFAETARLSGKDLLICFSEVDHPAVTSLEEKFLGSHVKVFHLKRDRNLNYLHDENFSILKDKKENNPELIILLHHLWVHNETGQVSSLQELDRFREIPDLHIHVDAVQAPGKVSDWKALKSGDAWTFSAHKFGALKGVGFTFMRKGIPFHSLILGGGQQQNLRSGTENVQGVKSVGLALSDLLQVNPVKTKTLRDKLLQFMQKELVGIGDIVPDTSMASNTIYFYFNSFTSDITLALFDLNGVELSAGSACSSGAAKASQVLLKMGLGEVAKNGLRLSLPLDLNEELLNNIMLKMAPVFNKLRNN